MLQIFLLKRQNGGGPYSDFFLPIVRFGSSHGFTTSWVTKWVITFLLVLSGVEAVILPCLHLISWGTSNKELTKVYTLQITMFE